MAVFCRFRTRILYVALIAVMGAIALAATLQGLPEAQAALHRDGVPRIVPGGVRMVDAWNMPEAGWQAWLSRPPGDDTYGSGDLIAVSVQFNEKVTVNPNTAFKFSSGFFDTERQLVYVAQDGSKVFFATGVNAGTGHPALGTLPDHKLNGFIRRPDVRSVRLLGLACDDACLRGEKIAVQVGFDQAVRVHGAPQAAIKIQQAEGTQRRRATHARGDGTRTHR